MREVHIPPNSVQAVGPSLAFKTVAAIDEEVPRAQATTRLARHTLSAVTTVSPLRALRWAAVQACLVVEDLVAGLARDPKMAARAAAIFCPSRNER
jgi:hypothetical protein